MDGLDLETEMEISQKKQEENESIDEIGKKDVWKCKMCEHIFKLKRRQEPLECPGCGKTSNKTQFEALTGPYQYFDEDQNDFIPYDLGKDIKNSYNFFVHPESDEIYKFNGKIYQPEGEKFIRSKAQDKLQMLVRNRHVKETIEWVRRCGDIRPEEDEINNPEHHIVVNNGILDIEEKELKRHDPKHLHITKIPWDYVQDADLGLIEDFVYDIVKDEDVKLLQEMFGYCLLKDYPIAKAFMLYGSGANGKSTLLNLLETFLGGENIATPSLHNLLRNKFAKIELYGKLANIHNDISNMNLYNTGVFKMLTGGDSVEGQRKYKDPIRFQNYAKLIYACNELPSTDDTTKAFFRRWVLIDFPYIFDEHSEDTDPNILDKMITEENMSGLLNWALEGLDRILENESFSMTDTRDDIEERWIRQSDSLQSFFKECVEVDMDNWISKGDLREAYKIYCEAHNIEVESKREMTTRGPEMIPRTRSPNDYRPKAHDGSRPQAWKNISLDEEFYEKYKFSPEYTSHIKEQVKDRQNKLQIEEEKA